MHFYSTLHKRHTFFTTAVIIGAVFIYCTKNLFFFDEDIFVTNIHSPFMQQVWQRSFMVKQFFRAEFFLWGKNPAGWHVAGVVLHLCCAVTALLVVQKILKYIAASLDTSQQQIIPVAFFILFLLAPIHSEPLCYILAQGVLLAAFFSLLSVLFFLMAVEKEKKYSFFSLLFFVLALLSYEISWLLPFMVCCLSGFAAVGKGLQWKKIWIHALPFFILFGAWIFIKTVFISKSLVADYTEFSILQINPLTFIRNTWVLLLRNFIPPFTNTWAFVTAGGIFVLFISGAVYRIYTTNRAVFKLLLFLLVLTLLAVLPTAPFGIDAHDSESERYVYFSSVFALFFLTVLIATVVKVRSLRPVIFMLVAGCYACSLYTTISYYKKGGDFSRQYIDALNKNTADVTAVFLINQPSQYEGALLLRAQCRMPECDNENNTVLNEYMQYLYHQPQSSYMTLSSKIITHVPAGLKTRISTLDSAGFYFPEIKMNIRNNTASFTGTNPVTFSLNNSGIAGLHNDSLYIFK